MSENKTVEQVLSEEGVFVSTTVGISMEPLLRTRRDTIIVEKAKARLKVNDVALYRRGDDYVLHRVIKVLPDSYVILGDHCINKEYGIKDEQIIGVLTAFYRKNRYSTVTAPLYRCYIAWVRGAYPIRCLYWHCRSFAARCRHKMVDRTVKERKQE